MLLIDGLHDLTVGQLNSKEFHLRLFPDVLPHTQQDEIPIVEELLEVVALQLATHQVLPIVHRLSRAVMLEVIVD